MRNVIELAWILEDGEFITTEFLPADLIGVKMTMPNTFAPNAARFVMPADGIPVANVELELARQAME